MMKSFANLSALFLLLAAITWPAQAQSEEDYTQLNDRFRVYLGGFFPNISSSVSINGEILPPDSGVSIENALGLEDSKSVLWGGGMWRISRRNSLEFEFANLNRSGSVSGDLTIDDIGDTIIFGDATIDSTFDMSIARLTYGFSIIRSDRMDLSLKGGLHLADLSISMQLSGQVCEAISDTTICDPNDSISGSSPLLESESVTAPLPHLGASLSYAFTPTIAARLQFIGFALEIDSIKGGLLEVDADVSWNPWRHFGIGAGVRYFNADVKSTGTDLNGEFDFKYYGPVIYVLGTF